VLALAAGVIAVTQQADARTGPSRINVTSQEKRFHRVDVGRPGLSPGDMELSWYTLYNRRITPRPIGRYEMVCTFTFPPWRSCRVTYFFKGGTLVAGGPMRFRQLYEFAVLGGTQLYDDARGTMRVTRIDRRPRRDRVSFRLIG
jgi:hypothetical protein